MLFVSTRSTVGPIKAWLKLRVQLRGKLRGKMQRVLRHQPSAQHTKPNQQPSLEALIIQFRGARHALTSLWHTSSARNFARITALVLSAPVPRAELRLREDIPVGF